MSDAVDLVVAAHTHSYLDTHVGRKLVVQAKSYGTAFDRVLLKIDRRTGDVVSASADIVPTTHRGLTPDPRLAALIRGYATRLRPLANRVLGHSARSWSREGAALGGLIARAERWRTGADLAFVNRATCATASAPAR